MDRRCAYATRICASVERMTAVGRGHGVGTVEILQDGPRRCLHMATFDEDVLGACSVRFQYGSKALNPAALLMRAICCAYHGTDVIGPMLKLVLPPALKIDGTERFHLAALVEPARAEFQHYQTITAKRGAELVNNCRAPRTTRGQGGCT